ncbi:MAG: LamG domain-containing protein [archaeon]
MGKKKVTLSVESKVYVDFKKYCDDRAIMLSKKVELIMKDIMKDKKGRLFFVLFLSLIFIGLASADFFVDSGSGDFNNGTFYQTLYNLSEGAVQLNVSQGFLEGSFTSRIFDGVSGQWNNLSWVQGGAYGVDLPDGNGIESEWLGGNVDMTGNVLLMHFDEASGTLYDFSGLGNDGTNNGAAYGADGRFNKALDFDGINDYAEVPTTSTLTPLTYITVEAWIYWKGYTSYDLQNIVSNGHPLRALRLTEPGHWNGGNQLLGDIRFRNRNCGSTGDTQLYSNQNISLGEWTHVAMTYDGSLFAIYINGELDNSIAKTGPICTPAVNIFIGTEEVDYFFNGTIDEVAIYNRSLSEQEIYDRFLRGAARLNVSVRSCDDAACSGESFVDVNDSSPQRLSVLDNRYFQYMFDFETLNESVNPELYNVTVDYAVLNTAPVVNILLPANGSVFSRATSLPLNFSVNDVEANVDSCWYNLDDGANVSLTDCQNITFSAGEGLHILSVFVNDSYGLESKNATFFRIDTTPPDLVIVSPQNSSYTYSNVLINLSLSDISGVGSCWYNLDYSVINFTLPGCLPTSFPFGDGSHFLIVWANDSLGNTNSSSVNFFVDATPPQWSDLQQSVPSVYSSNLSFFNITWIDFGTINSVLFESNFSGVPTNYSMYSLGGNIYGFDASLPAGGFYWRSHASDSLGNLNSSTVQSISVAKALNPVHLYLNGTQNSNLTVEYGAQTNATGVAAFGSVVLRRDGLIVSNPEVAVLAAKLEGYAYNVSVGGNQNYSGNSTVYYLFVNKLGGNVSLFLNGAESNLSVQYGVQTNATAWNVGVAPQLYRNGVSVSSSDVGVLAANYYNYTAIVADSENVTGSSKSFFLNVTRASPAFSLTLDGVASDLEVSYGVETNVTAKESNSGDGDLTYSFYLNDALVGGGSVVSDFGVYGVGIYTYTYNSSGGQNYTSGEVSRVLNITQTVPSLNLTLNGAEANATQTYGNESLILLSSDVGNLFLRLFLNSIEVANGATAGESSVLGVGVYNVTGIFEGNENYSSVVVERFLTVEKADSEVRLLLNDVASSLSVYLGTVVNISASLLVPPYGEISLYEGSILMNASNSSIFIEMNYTSLGNFDWEVFYYGNENYSAQNASFSVEVIDADSPLYSNLRVSPSSPVSYQSGRVYQFNATWTDNIGMDEVLFEFDGVNYSYLGGDFLRDGYEYYFELSDLAAGTYYYRWHGNDTSGNMISSPLQSYVVQKRTTSLWIQVSPGDTVGYGTTTITTCNANNAESQPELTRDITQLPGATDTGAFAAGVYTYTCTSVATQNYTSAVAVPRELTVNKASPVINLTLNRQESDLMLSSSGGVVLINASLISPLEGLLNLSVDESLINSGESPIGNESSFVVVGDHEVSAFYGGNENYTSGSSRRVVTVSAPSGGGDTGGGTSGGGGGGGGGGGYIPPPANKTNEVEIEFSGTGPFILKRGTGEKFDIEIANREKFFLNKCSLVFEGFAGTWFKSTQIGGLSPGEKFTYNVEIFVPESIEHGSYDLSVVARCEEGSATKSAEVIVYRNAFEAEILDYERDGNLLKVVYSLVENAGVEHDLAIEYTLVDFDGVARYIGNAEVRLGAREDKREMIEFDLPKDSFGEFKFEMKLSNDVTEIFVERDVFLPSTSAGLTGLAVSEGNMRSLTYLGIGVAVLVGLIIIVSLFKRSKRKTKKKDVLRSTNFDKKKAHKKLMEFEL